MTTVARDQHRRLDRERQWRRDNVSGNRPRESKVLLLQLSERTSARGNRYMRGWLGKAAVVAFQGEKDEAGNQSWDVYVSTPEPREGLAGGARARSYAQDGRK